ncbi:hypothetical protein [Cellulomonas sp. SLBN-39]|uniref:AMIN-like domain-containing (lipo)protein n=1 Tax=Cellulomonas sp. SLBN-39 TaxID=2768446 RepID=UPI0011547DCD|nr:hypothetical protein [Cellulomonas sp. SLBN-39]TQL01184.1 hypothetical protein FBY24_0228 [Cellulomonas sp. SLBN-39]
MTGTAAVLALGTALAGCAGQAEPAAPVTGQATSPAPAPTTPAPSPDNTAAPDDDDEVGTDFSAPGDQLTAEPAPDSFLTVVDVRTGEHDGYDRVVYELAGEGLPGWRVGYVDEAVEDPSGEVVDVDGDATLEVWVTGTGYPTDTGHEEFADDLRPGTGDLEHVTRPLTFEGMTQSFVGLDEQRPFRVTLLEDPVRVVVDVQDD